MGTDNQALTAYYTLPTSEVPSTDEEEFNAWVLHISSASGYNLAPYHEAWGFPLYPYTHSQLLQYPAWVDDPVRGDYLAFDPIIRNLSAGSTTGSSTEVDWQVYDNGTDVTLTLFYGQNDHGNVEGDWPQQTDQGAASVGDWSHVVSGLDPSTTYHARLRPTRMAKYGLIPLLGQPRTEGPDHALGAVETKLHLIVRCNRYPRHSMDQRDH